MIRLLFLILLQTCLWSIELSVDVGGGMQHSPAKGKLIYKKEFWKDSFGAIDHAAKANFYGWIDISSNNAYLPKMRFEIFQAQTEGKSFIHISANDTLNGLIEAIESKLPVTLNDTEYLSRLQMSTYETILYYEYFEGTSWPTLGLGLDLKTFDFNYAVTIIDGLDFNDHGGDTVPMLFFKSSYERSDPKKMQKLALEASAKIYVFGDSDIYDYSLKAEMTVRYNENTFLGIEAGYKVSYFNIKGDDIAKVGGTMDTSGAFVGFVGHFK